MIENELLPVPKIKLSEYVSSEKIAIFASLKQSWKLTKGIRLTLLAAIFIYGIISLISQEALTAIFPTKSNFDKITGNIIGFIISILLAPLTVGLLMLGVERARDKVISLRQLFKYFNVKILTRFLKLFLWLMIILAPLVLLFFLAITPFEPYKTLYPWYSKVGYGIAALATMVAIYLWSSYMFATLLIADKNLSAGKALTLSRKGFNQHWLRLSLVLFIPVLPLLLIVGISLLFSLSVMAIILILTMIISFFVLAPWVTVLFGVVYCKIFKEQQASVEINNARFKIFSQ